MAFGHAHLLETLVRRIEVRDVLSDEEKQALVAAAGEHRQYPAGATMVKEGDLPKSSTLLVEGITSRYSVTEDGRRQITAIHVPGDFVDLHSFPLQKMDHSIGAITACDVIAFPHHALRAITERHPHLTRLLWMLTLIDGAIHRRWLLSMGQTSALSHFAHFICEIYIRLEAVGLAAGRRMTLPITQAELGDILGISPVHVNRVLQDLRRDGLLIWEGGAVDIPSWSRLAEAGQFDDGYLLLERLPR